MKVSDFREYPELKEKIKLAGLTVKEIGFRIGESYSNLAGRLNGYLRLSPKMRREIEAICSNAGGN